MEKPVRRLILSTDGRVFVEGERGIVEVTDEKFLTYIRLGMDLKEVNLDYPATLAMDRSYEDASRKRLGPTEPADRLSDETIEEVAKMFSEAERKERKELSVCDPVNHPKHYCSHPSGIECIVIARCYDFAIGNAIKYLWRHGLKNEEGKDDIDKSIEDLEKAIWYIKDEIAMLENEKKDKQAKAG